MTSGISTLKTWPTEGRVVNIVPKNDGAVWTVVPIDTAQRLMDAIAWAHLRRRRFVAQTMDRGFEIAIESLESEDVFTTIYNWSDAKTAPDGNPKTGLTK